MTCDPRLISYYRDGALSAAEQYDVETHLRSCDACAAEFRGLMRMAQVVRSLPMVPVAPTLRESVYRAVALQEEEWRRPVGLAGIGRALAPAAIAASIAISSLVMFRTTAVEAPSSPAEAPVAVVAPAPANPPEVPVAEAPPPGSGGSPRVGAGGSGALGSKPALQAVADPNSNGLPVQYVNPAVVPEPIARLYDTNQQIRNLLGEASPGNRTVTLLEQSFQGGLAIWRSDTRQIYVLSRDGNTWSVHPDTWRPGDKIAVDTAPPPGAMVPAGGFGTVWRNTPGIKSRLGWAVYEPRGSGGSIQVFEHGMVVWTPHGLLYVLSDDGRWRTFPDASPL
jgi:hypothetical protein